ncbi:MAG: DUF3105 domain-containing protein [Aggregatilineales bacterium]
MSKSTVSQKTETVVAQKKKSGPLTFSEWTQTKAGLLSLLVLTLIVGVGFVLWLNGNSGTRPSGVSLPLQEDYPSLGQTHIADGSGHPPYNSNPPTSGWHYGTPANWGIYHATLPDETLVHNLEHGGIWLSYRDANDTQTIAQLDAIVNQFPDHVILTYRPTDDKAIAVAAWGHLLKLDSVDSKLILDFINRYIRQGPENV